MIPETIAALYAFLGLVAPGLAYQLIRERQRPALQETSFREASRIALTSAVFTTLSLATLALIDRASPWALVDAGTWLSQGTTYAASHVGLVARSAVYEVVLACVYACAAYMVVTKVSARKKTKIIKNDVWYQTLIEDAPKDHVAWVLVKLSDGSALWGHVDLVTVGSSVDDVQLSLKGPKLTLREGPSGAKQEQNYWKRTLVPASDVSLMKVTYGPKGEDSAVTMPLDDAEVENGAATQRSADALGS